MYLILATLDNLDKEILNEIQWTFPLVSQPYHELAKKFNIPVEEIKKHLTNLKQTGVLRQLSAIFDTRRLGYKSSSCNGNRTRQIRFYSIPN